VKKQKHDDLFDDDDGNDPLGDAPAAKPKGKKQHERIDGPFYMCPEAWADRAAEFAGQYLILALRLYRRWMRRKFGESSIAVSGEALAGPEGKCPRMTRARLVARLERGGLVEVVKQAAGQATRVRIIDPNLR
jgi:hypothetical protein